jgi:SulP family sulfate permease
MGLADDQPNEAEGLALPLPRVRFPFLHELRHYSRSKFHSDLVAGATLTLVSIPQAIGFSLIFGLPPAPVITSVMIGGFVGSLFFSSRHHVFGPTTSVCLIVASALAAHASPGLASLQLAAFLAFLIGLTQFVAGLLNFGSVTKFISRSVVVGYTTAIGVLLMADQVHNWLGFESPVGQGFLHDLQDLARAVGQGRVSVWALGIGLLTLAVFEAVKRLRPAWPEALIGLSLLGVAARLFALVDPHTPFRMVKDEGALSAVLPVFAGLPSLREHLPLLPHLAGTAVAIAIIGMLEATAITKTLAARSGQKLDPNQELLGMGAGNIACALFGVTPGSSSFTRSAVNFQSGAATQIASMLSSVVVLLILLFVTPIFNYIPVAALAAHLIRVGYKLINRPQLRVAWGATRSDAAVLAITVATALFISLETSIYVGIGAALVLFLRKTSTPSLVEYTFSDTGHLKALADKAQRLYPQISIIHVEGELFFGAADLFQNEVRRQAEDENIRVFILRMKNARHLDASTVMALDSLLDYLSQTGRHLLISGCSPDVVRVLRNSGLLRRLGQANIFPADPNPTLSTRRALLRARELLHQQSADIRVFYERVPEPERVAAPPQAVPPRDYEI